MNATEHYLDQYNAAAGALPGRELAWLQSQRHSGLERFREVGFPTVRDENWRYTKVTPITSTNFQTVTAQQTVTAADLTNIPRCDEKSHRLVFVDGLYDEKLSDGANDRVRDGDSNSDSGITVKSLARILTEQPELIERTLGEITPDDRHGFTALNNASSRDGVVILLAKNATVSMPIEVLFISCAAESFAQPRNLIVANENSSAQIVERHLSLTDRHTFTNSTTEIAVMENAHLNYSLVQTASPAARHISGVWAKQARGSHLNCCTVTLGGALVRNELRVELAGEAAHCDMLGLYHPVGTEHVDNHTTMIHAAENCTSRELYKGILTQRARAVFHGRIVVCAGAQKTDAAQTNNNLLLSRHAEIDTKPQLEIYADDVKCSHGATVGRIDEDALFYLRTRGMDEAHARTLLTAAFAGDVLDEIKMPALKNEVEQLLATRLEENKK